jgi:hypothetical protein
LRNDLQRAFAAYDLWYKAGEETDSYRSIVSQDKFSMFLGDPRGPHRAQEHVDRLINIYNPEVMKKINLILGPNGYALLKMWKAQMPEIVECSFSDFSIALHRLKDHVDMSKEHWNKLRKRFLQVGWAENDNGAYERVAVPTDILEWINILNGPHWQTMLKAYEIKVREDG